MVRLRTGETTSIDTDGVAFEREVSALSPEAVDLAFIDCHRFVTEADSNLNKVSLELLELRKERLALQEKIKDMEILSEKARHNLRKLTLLKNRLQRQYWANRNK